MATYKERNFADRRQSAEEAKKALLEKFKARPAADDPAIQARIAERKAVAEAREKREAERREQKRLKAEQEARERAEREQAAALAARTEAEAKEQAEQDMVARLLADEAERKARRDARYAARKARQK